MSLIRRGVQQDTDRCKLSLRPAEDALLTALQDKQPPDMEKQEPAIIWLQVLGCLTLGDHAVLGW